MRILIVGLLIFVIWSFISVKLYVNRILPEITAHDTSQIITEPQIVTDNADSLKQEIISPPDPFTVYFEFDKSEFKEDPMLDTSVTEIKIWFDSDTLTEVSISGHTDAIGNNGYNQELGFERALTVKKYLVDKEIPESRIIVKSEGENNPVGDNLTNDGRELNRRVEVLIKNKN